MSEADAESRIRLLSDRIFSLQAEIEALAGGEVDALVHAPSASPLLLTRAHGALLRQEQEFRALVEQSPDPTARFDPELRVVYANPALEALCGIEAAELRGRRLRDAGAWAGVRRLERVLARVVRTGRPHEAELLFSDGRGGVALSCRFHPEAGPDGRVASVLGVGRDTTARRQAEAALLASREFLHASMDALSAHLAVVDGDGRIVEVNAAWRRFGRENGLADGAAGDDYLAVCERVKGPDRPAALAAAEGIRGVLEGRAPSFDLEYPCDSPTEPRWFRMRVTRLEAGGRRFAVVAHENVTVQHDAQAEAEAERDRAVDILETITDAFFTLDAGWRFRYLNPQAEGILRRSRAELVGREIWDALPESLGSDFQRELVRVVRTRSARAFETVYPARDLSLEVRAFPAGDGVAVYFRDVSERRLREREAARLTERLREERALLSAVLQQLPVGVAIAEAPGGRIILRNDRVTAFMAAPRHVGGADHYEAMEGFHSDGRAVRAEEWPLARVLGGGGVVLDEEYRISRRDGELATVRMSAAPVIDAHGRTIAGVVVVSDVTAERIAARALRASEERYRLVFQATNDILWDWDLRQGRLTWNEALATVLGHPLEEEAGTLDWWAGQLHPEDRERVSASLAAAVAGADLAWSAEYRFRCGDGSYVRVLDRAYLLRDPAGRALRMIGSMVNLTERDRGAEAVRFQALLLDTVQQAVVSTDLHGVVTSWNRFAEELYGWSAAEVVGRTRAEIFGPAAGTEAEVLEVLWRGEVWSRELTLPRRHGGTVSVLSTRSFIRDSGGAPIGIVGVAADVTERRSLEAQLRQAQRMEAVGRLAGGVAHDFNNVLTIIQGNATFLLDDLPAEGKERLEVLEIAGAAERAAGLTRQLLAFSRRQILQPRPLDLNGLVAGIVPMLERLLGEDVELEFCPGIPLGAVNADPGQMEQVVMNLAVNARDAMADGGRISIETREVECDGSERAFDGTPIARGRYALLAVSDTGTGMTDEVLSHAFEPFFTTKEVGRGTGLGLAMVYGIVKQSGGQLWVYSEPGSGTVFKIYLPVAGVPAASRAVEAPAPLPGGTETLLVVEDEDAVRALARRLLTRFGYTVLESRDGTEALETAREQGHAIDAVLMDVVMPNLSGQAAAARLFEILPGVPVVFMSGYTEDEVLRRGVMTADALFVQKPFSPQRLLEVVRRALDGRR